ncbi:MAG TPA: prepilin-type N-terminal cleavage/methylation domain-containing protein [Candidatus Saccharimonadales bacterium]
MNINKKFDNRGFTIVELLIVIVVIAILAAITIVAYNGIQQRSHTTAQKSTAENLAKKIEAYNAIQNAYPTFATAANIVGAGAGQLGSVTDSSLAGSGISLVGTLSATTSDSAANLKLCTTASPVAGTTVPAGYVVYIWDSTLPTPAANPVQAGGNATITFNTGAVNTAACSGTSSTLSNVQ